MSRYELELIVTDAESIDSDIEFRGCVIRDRKSDKRYSLIGNRGLSVLSNILRDNSLREDTVMHDKRVLAMLKYSVGMIAYRDIDSIGAETTDRDIERVGIGIYSNVIWTCILSLSIVGFLFFRILYAMP